MIPGTRATPLLARFFARPHSAAADLYFTNAMTGIPGWRRRSATVFESDRAVLVVRNHLGIDLPRDKRLIYLIDDDLRAALGDPGLGLGYRARLALVEARTERRLARRAWRIVTTSFPLRDRLAQSYRREIDLMRPFWSEPVSDLSHHAAARARIGYLGSLTHSGDLHLALDILRRVAAAQPEVEIRLAANHATPDWLTRHPGFLPIRQTGWPEYRRALAGLGCHAVIYPLQNTALNRARSPNKLIEHAVAGAAALYPAHWPQSTHVTHDSSGLLLPDSVETWSETLLRLLADRPRLGQLAEGAQTLARTLNDAEAQRRFWRETMDLP